MNPAPGYKRYLLGILLVIYSFNLLDRTALGLLLQDIKIDLDLSDTQLGFMSGIAFAIFYSLMGIPIARWADRGNRVTIIALTTALWSGAVMLCASAASFAQLLAIRVCVGVGEAGCGPPAHSLISDYFTRGERPRAAAAYALGAPLSMLVGFFLAGWLNQLYGWRMTFVLLGLPGLGLAAVVRFSLKEPRCDALPSADRSLAASRTTLKCVCAYLFANRTYRHLLVGFSVLNLFVYGVGQWQPAFFVRSYGIQTGPLGTWFALSCGVGGLVGTYCGGKWASAHTQNEWLHLRGAAILYAALGILSPLIYLSPNPLLAFAVLAVTSFGYFFTFGPTVAVIQTLVPARMRAVAFALLYLFVHLIGIGLGPLVVGTLSDAWTRWAGNESLRYALLALSPGYFWAAWHIWRAAAWVMRDVESALRTDQEGSLAEFTGEATNGRSVRARFAE